MRKLIRPVLSLLVLLTFVTGVAYPIAITMVAQGLFPEQANGSLIRQNGRTLGSALIGQSFKSPNYFWSRPSATMPYPYNARSSAGSNMGPSNAALAEAIRERVARIRTFEPDISAPIPADLVTTSGSGLDPHISPAAALFQVGRVARIRGISADAIRKLVLRNVEGRTLGLLGEPRVNVLKLNLALDAMSGNRA